MKIEELIKHLESIKAEEGNINIYKWGNGFPKIINSVRVIETYDGTKKGVLLETI